MLRSLTLKLVLAFLFVSLIGVGLVTVYIGQRTQRAFDQFVLDRNQEMLVIALLQHYQTHNSWSGAETIFRYYYYSRDWRQEPRPAPVALVDAERQVVFGRKPDAPITQAQLDRGVPLKVDNKIVGWLLPDLPAARGIRSGLEQAFLARLGQTILYSAVGAAAVALTLSILLARTLTHPLHELIAATQAVAKGELGRQVPVRSQDELGQLAASFNQMSADLAQATELRRQMTADVAHELRTPLSLILGYTEALSDGKLQGSPETFEMMHDEARRLSRLVDDLRTLSLADAGELPLVRQPIEPRALLEHAALACAAQAAKQNISLQVEAAPKLAALNVDRDRMAQVLGNLVVNALRHTPAGGQITLGAEQTGAQIWLRVQDTGVGIAAEDLPHIFDRFYRGDKSRSRLEGESGLGLAIAKSIVEMHGGSITATSQVGQGATFIIALPGSTPIPLASP